MARAQSLRKGQELLGCNLLRSQHQYLRSKESACQVIKGGLAERLGQINIKGLCTKASAQSAK